MTAVHEAEQIISNYITDYGWEEVPFREALGRILAEDIIADRDLPPFDRVTMDGMAISYGEFDRGRRAFKIAHTQAAGATPIPLKDTSAAVEIMTGAALPEGADTVIRYEDIRMENGMGEIQVAKIKQGQNIHRQGSDKRAGEAMVAAGNRIQANILVLAAACGYGKLKVKKLPRVAIFSSGDEIVGVEDQPGPQQIRQSNTYAMEAMLKNCQCSPSIYALKDDQELIKEKLQQIAAEYDVLIMTGGVSKGKFDFIPGVLEEMGIERHFHRVSQKPGKPFWFGSNGKLVVFALPGNPVSTVLCMTRFVVPWLKKTLGMVVADPIKVKLHDTIRFGKPLTYFVQCKLVYDEQGFCIAMPIPDNGSGDFTSLATADGFVELPADQEVHSAGRVFPFYKFD